MAQRAQETLAAEQFGTIKNKLELLTKDCRRLRPATFCSMTQLTPTVVAGFLGIQRPRLYQNDLALKGKVAQRIRQIVAATDKACVLFEDNLEETKRWLMAPNTIFFNSSPFEIIMQGDGQEVLEMLDERLGQGPEVAP